MGDYDLFRKVEQTNISAKQRLINEIKYDIESDFCDSPSYEIITIDNVEYNAQIVSDTDKKPDIKKLLLSPELENIIKLGTMVIRDSITWLVTIFNTDTKIQEKCFIEKCNNVIKFYDKTSILNDIVSIPCVITSASKITLDENKYITDLDGNLVVKVPLNAQTLSISEGQRFILGRKVYMVSGFIETECDFINNTGVLTINMEITETDVLRDNFVNGIAFNEKDVINSYVINILNGLSISLSPLQTVNINTQVTNNGIVVTPAPELTFTSLDESIAVISESGVVTGVIDGNCQITVSLTLEPAIKSTVSVSIVSVIIDDYSIQFINPVSEIKIGKTQTFDTKVLNNGIEVSKDVVFSVRNEDSSSNVYATIESVSGTNCVVKATTNTNYRNKYFYLKCSLVEDSSVFVEQYIKVASLI